MSDRLRALVADDEPLARARLRRLLGADGAVDVVAECANGDEAVAALRAWRPDVAFLDVRMPDLDGFRVLEHAAGAQVVFVTAYGEHALRAFDAAAVDYLLKPLSPQRLEQTLARVRAARRPATAAVRGDHLERVAVPCGARMRVLAVADIDCIVARANYVELHAGGECHRLRATLAQLLARLDPARFVQVHRSRIVRIDAVRDIELLESGQYLLRLAHGARAATGARYRAGVREALGLGPA